MTNDMINFLISKGLTKQQAISATAETTANALMGENEKMLIREARAQVDEMIEHYQNLVSQYNSVVKRIDEVSGLMKSVVEAQNEYGQITDEKARTVVALTATLLKMFNDSGADEDKSATNVSYIVYAFLGGEARTFMPMSDDSKPNATSNRTIRRY